MRRFFRIQAAAFAGYYRLLSVIACPLLSPHISCCPLLPPAAPAGFRTAAGSHWHPPRSGAIRHVQAQSGTVRHGAKPALGISVRLGSGLPGCRKPWRARQKTRPPAVYASAGFSGAGRPSYPSPASAASSAFPASPVFPEAGRLFSGTNKIKTSAQTPISTG